MGPLAKAALPGSFTVPLAVLFCSPGLLSSIMLRVQGVGCQLWALLCTKSTSGESASGPPGRFEKGGMKYNASLVLRVASCTAWTRCAVQEAQA